MDNVKTRKFMSVSVTVFFTWCSEKEVISFLSAYAGSPDCHYNADGVCSQ